MAERVWIVNDKIGLRNTVELGLSRAESGDWSSGTPGERVRAFNGWLLERARLMAGFWGEVEPNPNGTEVYIYPGKLREVESERAKAAIALYRTIWILADEDQRTGPDVTTNIQITEGDVGAWPIIAAAAIVGIAQTAAIGYCAYQAFQVLDRQLARRKDLQMLVQRDKQVLDLAKQHQDREAKAGKQLPLDPVTKTALDSLLHQQMEIVKKTETPLSSGIPDVPAFQAGAAGFGVGSLATLAAVFGILYLLK